LKNDISFDLETFGISANSHVLSIGVAGFDIDTGTVEWTRHYKMGTADQPGRVICGKTVEWWLLQSAEARDSVIGSNCCLSEALNEISSLVKVGPSYVWGNGATFDISILEHAYNDLNQQIPWPFWDIRDMRTIVALAESLRGFDRKSILRKGTHHSAVDDAVYQAKVISAAYAALRS